MGNNIEYAPILVTGVERSGSTFVARILDMCGVESGKCNVMFENIEVTKVCKTILDLYPLSFPDKNELSIPVDWENTINKLVGKEHFTTGRWMIKQSMLARLWPIWNQSYPEAKWIIVRRRTGDIIQSCVKTGYMKIFKEQDNLKELKVTHEEDGWLWWIRRYEKTFLEIIEAGINHKIIWPDRMVDGNYEQMKEMVDWLGLKWNKRIPEIINPLLNKSRKMQHENNC